MGLLQILSRRPGKAKRRPDVSQQSQLPEGSSHRTSLAVGGVHNIEDAPVLSSDVASLSKASIQSSDTKPRPPFLLSSTPRTPDMGRPETPNSISNGTPGQMKSAQRPQRGSRRPPVSFRKPSSLLSMSSAYQASAPDAYDTVSERPGRSMSLSSTRSGRSKDLLDALEEIKTVEFRSRVLAAGARDYGEDVADRNIRQSRTFVSSPDFRDERFFDSPGRGGSITSQTSTPFMTPAVSFRAMSPPQDASEFAAFPKRNKNRLSLNTYMPSGIEASPHSPRSVVTSPGFHEAVSPRDFGSPAAENMSRRYRLSPTASNFSVPRSPRVLEAPIPERVDSRIDHHDFAEEYEFGDVPVANGSSSHQRGSSSVGHITAKQAGRFSNHTVRSSLASSISSRYPSGGDITPLGCPTKMRSKSQSFNGEKDDNDDSLYPRARSLHSHRHSRSNSSEDSHLQYRTKSLTSARSTALRDLVEIDEASPTIRGDWNPTTPSNGSTASSSNLHSASTGGRPLSRHTKATSSIDSTHRPTSSSGWSPATTKSTGFNIDDYISSDDDSFVMEKRRQRPTGEGEEELLFKMGYGVNGAALPGLLDDGACPAPVIPMRNRPTKAEEPQSHFSEDEDGDDDEEEDDDDDIYEEAREGFEEDDAASEDRELPMTLLRHVRSNPNERGGLGTFGRRSRRPVVGPAKAEEAADGSRRRSANFHGDRGSVYATMDAPTYRGQKRLSALGTLHGRNEQDMLMALLPVAIREEEEAAAAAQKVDLATAMRLRKEAKARKRAEGASSLREKRMTRAFGGGEEEVAAVLGTIRGISAEGLDRGRPLVRGSEAVVVGE